MSDDLVKRLRDDSGDWLTDLAADRIEELEASLQDARRVGAEWFEQSKQNHKRATTAEAKMAKAEHIVLMLASAEWDDRLGEAVDLACAYLAEVGEEK